MATSCRRRRWYQALASGRLLGRLSGTRLIHQPAHNRRLHIAYQHSSRITTLPVINNSRPSLEGEPPHSTTPGRCCLAPAHGNMACCSSAVSSGRPNSRFMFWMACPEAPFTRLSITAGRQAGRAGRSAAEWRQVACLWNCLCVSAPCRGVALDACRAVQPPQQQQQRQRRAGLPEMTIARPGMRSSNTLMWL